MSPDDPRHGQNKGYLAGCSQPCCLAAHAKYRRDLRARHYFNGGSLKIDATGTKRRIQALCALGWPGYWLDDELGFVRTYTTNLLVQRHTVLKATADRVAEVYERLSMTLPPTDDLWQRQMVSRTRNQARRKGWLPPLAWDDIDDPNERPLHDATDNDMEHDPAVVERILAGDWRLHATYADRVEVVRIWRSECRSLALLGRRTGWKPERYYDTTEEPAA